jgi:Tol biopolymer transport system component
MKRKGFLIFISIISIISFSVNVSKDTLLISLNDNTWITRQIAEKVKSIGNYMYDIEIKDVMTESIKTEEYDVIMNIFTNTKENITIAFGYFQGGGFSYSETTNQTADWVEKFSVKALENLSFQRFLYGENWDILQLTFWKGVDEYPIYQNEKLYFISDRYIGNREIYIFDFANGTEIKIPLESSAEYFPDISPNNNFLVFQTSLFGKWDIVLYDLTTKKITRISPTNKNAYSPYFYDNTLILFSMENESGQGTEIWYYDLYYKKLDKLSDSKTLLKFRPSKWNGNNITFYAINLEDASVNIYYLDEDNKIFPLIAGPFNQTDSWSNGSELLVFSEFNGKYFSIYEYNKGEKINLTSSITNDCFYPTYSPDKKYVFFTNYYSEADIFVLKRQAIYNQTKK